MGMLERDGSAFEFTFTVTPDNPVCDALSLVMQDSLSKLGIRMTVQTVDFNTMYDKIFDGTIDMWFGALGLFEPVSTAVPFRSPRILALRNSANDTLIEEIDGAKDIAQPSFATLPYEAYNEEMPRFFFISANDFFWCPTRITGRTIDSYNDFFS